MAPFSAIVFNCLIVQRMCTQLKHSTADLDHWDMPPTAQDSGTAPEIQECTAGSGTVQRHVSDSYDIASQYAINVWDLNTL